jgi:hypothetical protein
MQKMIFLFPALSILLFSNFSFPQDYSSLDSIHTGRKYKFILFDETEVIGKVVSQDSVSISLQTEKMTVILKRDNIFSVTQDLYPSKYEFIFSASGGICFPTGPYDGGPYGRLYKRGLTFETNGLLPFSDTKGMTFELSYSRIKRDADYYGYYGYNGAFEGGELTYYSFKLGFVVGTLKGNQPLFAFADFSAGIHFSNWAEIKETYYSVYDSTYHTYIIPAYSSTDLVLGIGGVLGYRVSRNFGIYGKLEYNMIASGGYFFFWGNGYFPLRLGVSYFIR